MPVPHLFLGAPSFRALCGRVGIFLQPLSTNVILSEVRREPNAVEGPLHWGNHHTASELLTPTLMKDVALVLLYSGRRSSQSSQKAARNGAPQVGFVARNEGRVWATRPSVEPTFVSDGLGQD